MNEEQVRQLIREELASLVGMNKYTFQKNLQIFDGYNIQLGRTRGTKIGTADDQKMSVYGETPVIRASHIADPAGGTADSQARTAINSILVALENFGILKKS